MKSDSSQCSRCHVPLGRDVGSGVCAACMIEDALPAAEGLALVSIDCNPAKAEPFSQHFGGYELLEEIGRGGMGVIYKARQPGLGRVVALKMLLAGEFADAKARERLLREARMAARLAHPGIVAIYEVGVDEGRPFFAMEYVPGRNLAELCREGLMPVAQAARYVEELARAVHYAHERGVIHCDLKPANVLIDPDDEPRLTDFGLTKSLIDPTRTLESSGSPSFMAPEQADSALGPTGVDTDVFGLGAILYYLLTGHPPVVGETLAETLRAVAACEPVAPRQLRPAAPRDLETITLKCLRKDRSRRYRSALEIGEELARWRRHEPIMARPAGAAERVGKWVRRRPALATLAGALTVALLLGISGILWQWRRAETEKAVAQEENYAASLQLAQQRIEEGNFELARELLFAQPERLRHVEWGRLIAQCFPTLAVVSPDTAREMRLPPLDHFDGRVAAGGEYFVTWGGGITQLWRTRDGNEIRRWGGADETAGPAEFSPDGTLLLLAGPGPGFSMWEAPSGKLRFARETNQVAGNSLGFSPDGRFFYARRSSQSAEIWESETGRLLHFLETDHQPLGRLSFSRDGKRIWNNPPPAGVGRLQTIWELDSGRKIASIPATPETSVHSSIAAGGGEYAMVDSAGAVEVWKVGAGSAEFRTPEGTGPYASAAVTSKGKRLIASLENKAEIDLWDLSERRLIRTLGERVRAWRITPNEKFLLTGGTERFIRVWDLESGALVHRISTGQPAAGTGMEISPDGKFLISFGWDDTAAVCALDTPDPKLRYGAWPVTSAFSPDSSKIAAPYLGGKLLLWDLNAVSPIHLHGHRAWVSTAEFSPDGQWLYSGSTDATVRMWDVNTARLVHTATNHTRAVLRLLVSADGATLVSSDFGGRLWIWDAHTLRPKRSIQVLDPNEPTFFDLHPAGDKILALSPGGIVEWDAVTGEENWRVPAPNLGGGGISVAFYSPDGARFVVGRDDVLELWQRQPLRRLVQTRGRGRLTRSIFTPDGRRLLTVSVDASASSIGATSIEVRDAGTLKLLVSLAPSMGTGLDIRLSKDERFISRTRIDDSPLGTPIDLWRVFPWRERDYPGPAEAPFSDRVSAFAGEQWPPVFQQSVNLARIVAVEKWSADREEWPARDPATPVNCIDLTPWYNRWLDSTPVFVNNDLYAENHLGEFPRGLVRMDNIPFDVRGIVAGAADFWTAFQPADTKGIVVGQKCQKLHFLHCASIIRRTTPLVARYRLNYVDGQSRDLEARLDQDIFNWWGEPGEAPLSSAAARIVWRGHNPAADKQNSEVRVCLRTWDNPLPHLEIATIDFMSERTPVNPLLIALTLE